MPTTSTVPTSTSQAGVRPGGSGVLGAVSGAASRVAVTHRTVPSGPGAVIARRVIGSYHQGSTGAEPVYDRERRADPV